MNASRHTCHGTHVTAHSLSLSLSMFSDMGKVLVNDFQNVVSLTHNGHAVGVSGIGGYFTYQVLCVQNPVHSSAQEPYISTKKP